MCDCYRCGTLLSFFLQDYYNYGLDFIVQHECTLLASPLHKTSCFKPSYNFEPECTVVSSEEIEINVKLATKFCDTEDCYRTRSKNRGHVLIINNIQFDTDRYQTRRGAEKDENHLKELFGVMGFIVDLYRNLSIDVCIVDFVILLIISVFLLMQIK